MKIDLENIDKEIGQDGFVSEKIMKILKKTSPIFCVDGVLVPISKKPSALLVYRDEQNMAAPNKYWFVRGRVNKGKTMAESLQNKIKKEINLDVKVYEKNQLFARDLIHIKSKKDNKFYVLHEGNKNFLKNVPQNKIYHTPVVCFLVRIPPYGEIKNKIKRGNGNIKYKIITEIDESLHPYVKEAISLAWKKSGY
ncbi:MAG: hypothetical protein IIA85_00125 [Nanoarchaeota archaeon]|nr:hypothetical protein [Nanoarchaeota archaeon]